MPAETQTDIHPIAIVAMPIIVMIVVVRSLMNISRDVARSIRI